MARVTYIKAARQRYATVPVLNEDGTQKVTPVMRRDGVTPKTTKTGRPVTMRVTISDKSKPLPNLRCDFPNCEINGGEILVGTAYKHITPRSGPYGGTQKNRHAVHPSWNVWEYSYSRSAQVARTQNDMHDLIGSYEFSSTEDFDDLKTQLQDMAQEQLDEQEDALSNMPEQLQDGSQAQQYVEALEEWVNEFDNVNEPDETDTEDCQECDGTGVLSCEDCEGSGKVYDESAPTEDCDVCEGKGEVACEAEGCEDGQVAVEGVSETWIEAAREELAGAVDSVQI